MNEAVVMPILLGAAVVFLGWSTYAAKKRGEDIGAWRVFWLVLVFMIALTVLLVLA